MKNTVTIIILAASLMVSCGLLGVMFVMYKQVRDVNSAQQQELASMQDEYNNADVITLNGQIVRPAEAISLVRKYGSSVTIQINGVSQSPSDVTRSSFSGSQFRVETSDTNGNGSYDTINFKPFGSGDSSTPAKVSDAINIIGQRIGMTSASWQSVLDRLDVLNSANAWKTKIAALVGSDETGSWQDVYYDLLDYTSQSSTGGSNVQCERLTLLGNANTKYQILQPIRGIVTDASGEHTATLSFGPASCTVKGDSTINISVNVNMRTITNNSGQNLVVYLYSE